MVRRRYERAGGHGAAYFNGFVFHWGQCVDVLRLSPHPAGREIHTPQWVTQPSGNQYETLPGTNRSAATGLAGPGIGPCESLL